MSKSRKPTPPAAPARPTRPPGPGKSAVVSRKTAANTSTAPILLPDFFTNFRLQTLLIFGFAFLLYANSLFHGFVLDDSIVITDNMFTKQGVQGIPGIFSKDTFFGFFKVEGKEALVSGGRYRPMTLALFALVYQVVGENSFVFHLLTVLLFALTCVVLYRVLLRLFANQGSTAAALLAWIATVLFVAHPIHTEVVNNIKGCDEIVTLLGCLTALWCTFKAVDTEKTIWKLAAGAAFFLACLSKENAAAFVIIIPLSLWFSHSSTANTDQDKSSSIVSASWPIWAAFALFFILRGSILHWQFGATAQDLMNNPFLKFDGTNWIPFAAAEKFAAIFYTLGKYILLLFVPHPLTHDYYPRVIGMVSFLPIRWCCLASLAYGYLGYQAVIGLRQRSIARFGIWLYLLPLSIVSNFLFPIGTNMGERFAFMPSVGFCIAAAALLIYLANRSSLKTALIVLGVVVVLFSLKTVWRNTAWSSNENLFFTDVGTSDNSAKIHNACGGILFDRASKETNPEKRLDLCRQSVAHLNKALEIYPNYKDAYITRGGANFYLKNYDSAIADYRQAVHFGQDDPRWKTYLAMALRDGGQYYGEQKHDLATAQKYLAESWQINNQDAQTARLQGVANGVQGKNADAIAWFQKAVALDPKNASYLFDLGTAYYASGDAVNGELYHQQAIAIDPKLKK